MLVVDNFLNQHDPLLREIQEDRLWMKPLGYSFLPRTSCSTNTWETMAFRIWEFASSFKEVVPDYYEGIEYWSNIMAYRSSIEDLPWHFDKDEHLFSTKEILRTPCIGSVYYAHKGIPEDGYLEVQSGSLVERLKPISNRLIIFDSGDVHRVTHVTKGLRRCFATNVWVDKPSNENFS